MMSKQLVGFIGIDQFGQCFKIKAYIARIGTGARGREEAIRDCLKIAHYACYLHAVLTREGK